MGAKWQDVGDIRFHPHPPSARGQALTLPRRGFTGVCNENNHACCWDFTPIPAFPRQGGRSLRRGFSAVPATFGNELYRRCSNTYPSQPIKGEGKSMNLTLPRRGFTGVCNENNRACCWDFTPIPAFPRQGGRSLWLGFSAVPATFGNELYMRCSNTYPSQPVEGEGRFITPSP